MKNVLITGAGSYVGEAVRHYLEKWPEVFRVSVIDTIGDAWKTADFSFADTVFHVAGMAHSDIGHADETVRAQYFSVNTDLAVAAAKKAKEEGVHQFIFMSSAIVYGDSAPVGKQKIITRDTPVSPANFYGESKVRAENGLLPLEDNDFRVVVLRCPMIYGKGSKGNFPVLKKMADKLPLFPKIENRRSMLYITNLAEFVRLMIVNDERGLFWPCNKEWSNTSELVKMIAEARKKKCILIPGFGWAIKLMGHFSAYVNKAFGNLAYYEHLGDYKTDYRLYTLEQSIKEIEDNG